MSLESTSRPARREFLGQLGMAAGALVGAASLAPLLAESSAETGPARENFEPGPWDLAWVDKVARAKYSVVFDANVINDGLAMNLASTFLDQFHEVYDTRDEDTRAVIVMRQLGTPMAFNDSMWERYPIGEDTKITDETTKAPVKKNPFWHNHDASWTYPEDRLERLTQRGVSVVVCNQATLNWSRRMAGVMKRDVAEVFADAKANLIPTAVLAPTGIFALIRAQNAGAAFMRG